MQALNQRSHALPQLYMSLAREPTEAEFVKCGRIVKLRLEAMRKESSLPVKVERMRRTRTGWAVIYRLGDSPQGAFNVDAGYCEPQIISPEQAIALWVGAS